MKQYIFFVKNKINGLTFIGYVKGSTAEHAAEKSIKVFPAHLYECKSLKSFSVPS